MDSIGTQASQARVQGPKARQNKTSKFKIRADESEIIPSDLESVESVRGVLMPLSLPHSHPVETIYPASHWLTLVYK